MVSRVSRARDGIGPRKIFRFLCWTPVLSSFILWLVTFTLQGRELGPQDLGLIRQLIVEHPDWSRWRLSQVLCQHWNWRNGAGQLKDMASRTLLLKLQERGHIQLPPRRQTPANRMRQTKVAPWVWDGSAIVSTLAALGWLQVGEVSQSRSERQQVAASLSQFHYLGFCGAVGENLQYTGVRWPRPLAGVLGLWFCRLEVSGPGPVHRVDSRPTESQPVPADQQHPFPGAAVGAGTASGQLGAEHGAPTIVSGLAGQVWASHSSGGNVRRAGPVPGNSLPGSQLDSGGRDDRP